MSSSADETEVIIQNGRDLFTRMLSSAQPRLSVGTAGSGTGSSGWLGAWMLRRWESKSRMHWSLGHAHARMDMDMNNGR